MKRINKITGLALGVGLLGLGVASTGFAQCCGGGGGIIYAPRVVVAGPGCCNNYYAPSLYGYGYYPYYRAGYYGSPYYSGCQRVVVRCRNNCGGYGCGLRPCYRYVVRGC